MELVLSQVVKEAEWKLFSYEEIHCNGERWWEQRGCGEVIFWDSERNLEIQLGFQEAQQATATGYRFYAEQ